MLGCYLASCIMTIYDVVPMTTQFSSWQLSVFCVCEFRVITLNVRRNISSRIPTHTAFHADHLRRKSQRPNGWTSVGFYSLAARLLPLGQLVSSKTKARWIFCGLESHWLRIVGPLCGDLTRLQCPPGSRSKQCGSDWYRFTIPGAGVNLQELLHLDTLPWILTIYEGIRYG